MHKPNLKFLVFILLGAIVMSCAQKEPVIKNYAPIEEVKGQLEKFKPVEID